jgi:aryl-alcohol dehydrogenase-like predicted oxidoreductase
LRFLTENGRSLTQAAIQFALAQPLVACVLPTITTLGDLQSCIAACDTPALSRVELNRLDDLVKHGFHLEPFDPPTVYNG